MTTGTVIPRMSFVRSLNCVTNAPMLTPCWPSAGPTGGAGVAQPPGHCSLTSAVTCPAIFFPFSKAFHLVVFEIDRRWPTEDRYLHLHPADRFEDLLDSAFHAVE